MFVLLKGGKTTHQIKKLHELSFIQNATVALLWLSDLNLPIDIPTMTPLEGMQPNGSFFLPAFKNGVLLCQIIQCLERMKQPLQGYCAKPRSNAQCVQNVRRALEALIQKSGFPVIIKSWESEILQGRGEVIIDLLLRMKESYKHFKKNNVSGVTQKPARHSY